MIRSQTCATPSTRTSIPQPQPCPEQRQPAPHAADWVATCGAGCRCSGQGCGCRMLVRVEGVAHIWDRGTAAVAAMLDRAMMFETMRETAA